MANERVEPEISNIVLDQEDREAFQRARAKQKNPAPSGHDPDPAAKSGVSGIWLFLTLLVAIGACGASLWLYQQKLIHDRELDNAVGRVAELERRLSVTGEEMDQSAGALRVKVSELTDKTDELWNQMDKLWSSAWRRNQAEIAELNEKLGQQTRQTDGKINLLEADVSTTSTNLAVIQEQMSQQANELAQLSTLFTELKNSDNNNSRQIGDIQAKLVALDQVNGALTRRVAELEKWRRTNPTQTSKSTPSVP